MNTTSRIASICLLTLLLTGAACSSAEPKPDDDPSEQTTRAEQAGTTGGDSDKGGRKAERSEAAQLPDIEVPHETFVLDNGLTVVVHEDHKTPVVAVNVWYHVGAKDEQPGRTGFAHLFEHLMFQGTENFQGEFFEPLEKAGATDMNGTTNHDRTNYFQTVPTSALDVALWMESDRMGHFRGAISQELLDEQRGVVQNEKRQGLNRPYGEAWELIPPNTYPENHPYSWSVIGSMEDLNAASLEDVKEWFKKYYGASNAVVVMAGDITPEKAREKAEQYFGHIDAGPAVKKRGPWIAKMEERRELTTYDQVPQKRSYYVYNLPPYGREATEHLRLAAKILGKGKNSRLYERLVYRDQLATDVNVWFGDGEIGSQLYVIADARDGVDLEKVERALDEEIARLAEEGPTQKELDRVRMSYFADKVAGLEKVGGFSGKTDMLARNATYLGDAGAYKRLHEVIRTATPDEVQQSADAWLTDGLFVLRVLPDPGYKAANAESAADRSELPEVGETPGLDLPDLERATLSNGLEVVLAERHSSPMVRFKLLTDGGYAADPAGKLGSARLAMDLLDEGTDQRGALELAAELERLGADLSSGADLDYSYVNLKTLSTTVGPALDVYADVIRNPAFADEEIERRRKKLLASIDQEKAEPFSTALRMLGPLVFGDSHPYGIPLTGSGSKESVKGLTRDDLVDHHRRSLRPDGSTLLVVGDTTMADLKPKLEARLGDWKAEGEAEKAADATIDEKSGPRIYLVDKPDAEQSLIVAGNPVAPRDGIDQIATDAANAAVGGTFTARINMNLREEKHWSYGAYSFIYETAGEQLFAAYAKVQTDKTSESMTEILGELKGFTGDEPITEEELAKVQQNKTRKLPGQNETTGELLGSLAEIIKYDLPDDYFDTYADKIRALTTDEVQEAAGEMIKLDEMTWIVIGDLDKIEEKVRELDVGTVEIVESR